MKYVQINYERCIGCRHCELACILEHSFSKDILLGINDASFTKGLIKIEIDQNGLTFPVNCRHCDMPLCMNVCPMSAIKRDEDGFVQIDPSLCIGCGICGLACPFGIIIYEKIGPSFEKRVALKCDGCQERINKGRLPACVEACKTKALTYESLDEYEREKRKRLIFSLSEVQPQRLPDEIRIWRDYLKELNNIGERKNEAYGK